MKFNARIIRTVALVLSLLLMTAVLFSCDGKEKETEEMPGGSNKSKDTVQSIFHIKYEDTVIELGKDAGAVKTALGEAKKVNELGDCGGLGSQVEYVYDNFYLYTVKNDKTEIIDGITLTNDLVATPKGVGIGDEQSKVTNAYGTPAVNDERSIQYKSADGKMILKFGIKDGCVSSINYITSSN